jgi:PTS system fructose-specific IIC component/PTS system nitrogen regulatory IIA component
MKLSSKIKKSAIQMEMSSSTKDEAIDELVDLLCSAYRLKDREAILEAIRSREAKASTGIGMGLAVPHAKTTAVDRLYVAFGLSRNGIDFESLEGELSHLFFIMVSAKDKTGPHIQALAGISRLIKHEEVRNGLMACQDVKEFLSFIVSAENRYL